MRRGLLFFFSAFFLLSLSYAQEWGIKFKGFVKADYFFDSRQVVAAREGHFLLYPKPEVLDADGKDLNANPSFNILAIQTRLTGVISAPDAFGAKVSGVIEGAFFGHTNADINGFRLRHAFLKLDWGKTNLILGQYWHPFFVTQAFPGVISFNTGVPIQFFSRNPQIRLTTKMGPANVILAACAQRDFASPGPQGASSIYLRNAVIPDLQGQVQLHVGDHLIGLGGGYKSLRPTLESDNMVSGVSGLGYVRLNLKPVTVKLWGLYGQNVYDGLMLGGYATKKDDSTAYTPYQTLSAWFELIYGGNTEFGLFAGYTQNLGAADDIGSKVYARGANIASVMRVSPRVVFKSGKTWLAVELEYTQATYAETWDTKGKPDQTKDPVSNIRLLFAGYLFF